MIDIKTKSPIQWACAIFTLIVVVLSFCCCGVTKKNVHSTLNKVDSSVKQTTITNTAAEKKTDTKKEETNEKVSVEETNWTEFSIDSGQAVVVVTDAPGSGPDKTIQSSAEDYISIPATNTPRKIYLPKNKRIERENKKATQQTQQTAKEQGSRKEDKTTEVKTLVKEKEKNVFRFGIPWYVWLILMAAIAVTAIRYRKRIFKSIKRFDDAIDTDS
jgi:hypothetical protein